MSKLGALIEAELSRRGQAQISLAKALNTSPTNVSRWIKGQTPEFDALLALADYFSMEPEKIFALAGKSDLLERYKRMRARESKRAAMSHDSLSNEDREVHRKLQVILDTGGNARDTITMGIEALWSYLGRKGHGPHAPGIH